MMLDGPKPVLEIRDLSVSVGTDEGEARILERVGLALMPGSIHGIVGESGCGKSTLMRAILGILPKRGRATAGEIMLGERDLLKLPPDTLQKEVRGACHRLHPAGSLPGAEPRLPRRHAAPRDGADRWRQQQGARKPEG